MATQGTKLIIHIDFERRKLIERGLDEGRTLTYIAREVEVEVSTIRREILRRTLGTSHSVRTIRISQQLLSRPRSIEILHRICAHDVGFRRYCSKITLKTTISPKKPRHERNFDAEYITMYVP